MESDVGDVFQQLAVERLDVAVVGDMVVDDSHLAAADACADVRHSVVVAYGLMLVIRIAFAGLCGIP